VTVFAYLKPFLTYLIMKLHTPESTSDLTKKVSDHIYLPFPAMLQPKNLIALAFSLIITFPVFKSSQAFMSLMWATYRASFAQKELKNLL